MFSRSLITLLALASYAAAHGMVGSIKIGGKTYPGAAGAGGDPANSPVRPVQDGGPVKDLTSADTICGLGGANTKPAPVTANVNAGDKIDIYWKAQTGGLWFHNVGPVMSYMTPCQGSCTSFKPDSSTKWFKVDEKGESGDLGTPWFQAQLDTGAPAPLTIPAGIASGEYLIRTEIIALQLGQTVGGAEFYPNCIQVNVQNGGSTKASSISPTAQFPGAYKPTDPGITVDVYTPANKAYAFPGPAVAKVAGGSGSSGSGPAAPVNPAPSPSTAGSAPKPTHTKTCKKSKAKRNATASIVKKSQLSAHKKRRLSAH